MQENEILGDFLKKDFSVDSVEHRVYEIAVKYFKSHQSSPYSSIFQSLSTDLLDSAKREIKVLESRCQKYLEEIQNLSEKLSEADNIVNDEVKSKEKVKQFLSELRIENSNLILANRGLRKQLLSMGLKIEDNEKIIRKLSICEGEKEIRSLSSREELLRRNTDVEQDKFREVLSDSNISLSFSCSKESMLLKKQRLSIENEGYISASPKRTGRIRTYTDSLVEFQQDIDISAIHAQEKKTNLACMRIPIFCSIKNGKNLRISRLDHFAIFPNLHLPIKKIVQTELTTLTIASNYFPQVHYNKSAQRFPNKISKEGSLNIIRKCPISLSTFRIFVCETGRAQVDQIEMSDDEELLISKYTVLCKPVLSISPAKMHSYKSKSKEKDLTVKKQASVQVAGKKKSLKIELVLFGGIFPKKSIISLSAHRIYSISLLETRKKVLEVEDCESFSIIQSIQITEYVDISSGKRGKQPPKRTSAIEEYFVLVILT